MPLPLPSPEPRAGWLMSWLFPIRMRLGYKFMYEVNRKVVRVSPWSLIKGPSSEQELEAMLFVSSHTTIPCPKVYRTYRRKEGLFIEMEYITGANVETAWSSSLSESTKQHIGKTVGDYVRTLRELEPPKDCAVASAAGGPVKDGRIGQEHLPPFKSTTDFQKFLYQGERVRSIALQQSQENENSHNRQLARDRKTYRTFFAHADICPRNLILKADGTLVMIDWELAGWWPEYWEYTKCYFAMFLEHRGWLELIDENLDVYPAELEIERRIWNAGLEES